MEKQFQLPEEYLQHMKSLLGEEEYLNYIKSFDSKRYQGLRANGIKIAPGIWKKSRGFLMDFIMETR